MNAAASDTAHGPPGGQTRSDGRRCSASFAPTRSGFSGFSAGVSVDQAIWQARGSVSRDIAPGLLFPRPDLLPWMPEPDEPRDPPGRTADRGAAAAA